MLCDKKRKAEPCGRNFKLVWQNYPEPLRPQKYVYFKYCLALTAVI